MGGCAYRGEGRLRGNASQPELLNLAYGFLVYTISIIFISF